MYFVICILLFSYELIYPASRRCADDAEMLLPESGCDAYRNRCTGEGTSAISNRKGKSRGLILLCRKSDVWGKRVDFGGRRIIKKRGFHAQ